MKAGKITSIPLVAGSGKSPIGDFVSFLPVNLLEVPAGAAIESAFLRSFPGLVKIADVDGGPDALRPGVFTGVAGEAQARGPGFGIQVAEVMRWRT